MCSSRATALTSPLAVLVACSACHPDRPDGWTEETHGKDAEPNYPMVLAQDEVKRIDLVLDSADWQAMLDDMTEIYGEPGTREQPIGIPPEVVDACTDLDPGAPCAVETEGNSLAGECDWLEADVLACDIPEPGDGLDPRSVSACEGRLEGEVCDAPTPMGAQPGTCLSDGLLFCAPDLVIAACHGLLVADPCTLAGPPGAPSGTCADANGTAFCAIDGAGGPEGPGGPPPMQSERDPIWVPCRVEFEAKAWWHVGIRFKGNSTLSMTWSAGLTKLPFKLDFDQFEDGYPEIENQRFYGFKRLAFANNARDDSYLRDKVAGDLFREVGVPAPQRAFVRVFVDTGDGPTYFGLYTMAEIPHRPMYLTQLGGTGGNLYKPDFGAATWQAGRVIDESSFSKKSNEEEADWSDVEAAVAALHASRAHAESWRAQLERRFDADGFMRWLAVNTVIQDWDTYGNGAHNYYLYGDPAENGRLRWIPWDHNESLKDSGGMRPPLPLDMSTVGEDWPLIRFLIDEPVYHATYRQAVRDVIETVFERESVRARLRSEHALIAPFVAEEVAPHTVLPHPAAFAAALDDLFEHVDDRHDAVRSYLHP